MVNLNLLLGLGLVAAAVGLASLDAAEPRLTFDRQAERVTITVAGEPFAKYVFSDKEVARPYFCDVHAAGGIPVTRRHPPVEGTDQTDHAMMHPGLWLAFGDLGGADFWRNKGRVEHVEFVEAPRVEQDRGRFVVKNRYVSDTRTLCSEVCWYTVAVRPAGILLLCESTFTAQVPFAFGDQEEMGFGVRLASPLRVRGGNGRILSSEGHTNEKGVWGRTAAWCDYSGTIDGKQVGLTLIPHPENFRPSWFHVRDYGLMVANPFGQNAFTREAKSRIEITPEKPFSLGFAVLIHASPADKPLNLEAATKDALSQFEKQMAR